MTLEQAQSIIEAVEARLHSGSFVVAHVFERDDRSIHVALTLRLKEKCERIRVWKSRAFLQAFKNAAHGFDPIQSRRRSGKDGIFLLDRDYRPKNEMMRKMFTAFLDREGSGADEIAKHLGVPLQTLKPVRLVAHHGRLLGVLSHQPDADWLVLVDWDDTE
ncbi:hypothetical protein [Lacunisphaera limnophila]|uniref:hypothetical protein n=1 Tax=Lacunisphaera limnophila TaxID=1838286 RepID=UPI0008597F00|nr:hypothetical protein [Lacunisphaera limnophila]